MVFERVKEETVPVNSHGDTVAGDGITPVLYTLEEMVNILCEHGTQVTNYTEGSDGMKPRIYFGGGWTAAGHAAFTAKCFEFPISTIGLMWRYYNKGGNIKWEMVIHGSGIRREHRTPAPSR